MFVDYVTPKIHPFFARNCQDKEPKFYSGERKISRVATLYDF